MEIIMSDISKRISSALDGDVNDFHIDKKDWNTKLEIKKLLKQRKEIASDFLNLKNPDLDKAMFYTSMIAEVNDRINFYLNNMKERRRSRAFAEQARISRKADSMTRFIIFIALAQLVTIAALIILIF
jgi:hypothetical protein